MKRPFQTQRTRQVNSWMEPVQDSLLSMEKNSQSEQEEEYLYESEQMKLKTWEPMIYRGDELQRCDCISCSEEAALDDFHRTDRTDRTDVEREFQSVEMKRTDE